MKYFELEKKFLYYNINTHVMIGVPATLSQEGQKNLFHMILSATKDLIKFTNNESKIYSATQEYADTFLRRYGSIKVLGMSEPVPLQDLYTEVHIVSSNVKNKERMIEDMETKFRSTRGNLTSEESRKNGIAFANEKAKLNVLGAPGSGKTTLLRKIGLECLMTYENPSNQLYKQKVIPVLIELKRFKNEQVDLKNLIQKEFEIAGFPDTSTFLDRALEKGILLILLDGIDEVPESVISDLLEHLKDFTDKYYKNRFISSCRTAYYRNYLSGFTDVEISNFNDEQIKQFINNWFFIDQTLGYQTSENFIRMLFIEANKSTLELARPPLLLTFLCLSYDNSQQLPTNRSTLYQQALSILMYKWAAEKRIHTNDIYQELNIDLETELLADVAQDFFNEDKIFFTNLELKHKIQQFLSTRISVQNLDTNKILFAIEVQQGILVERSNNIYSFSHLTIQEYLTARFYRNSIKFKNLIKSKLFDRRWREVFLLMVGIGDPNEILNIMLYSLNEFKKTNNVISEAVLWTRNLLSDSKSQNLDPHKRIFLISLLLRYRRYETTLFESEERLEISADLLISQILKVYSAKMPSLNKNITAREIIKIANLLNSWGINSIDLTDLNQKLTTIELKKNHFHLPGSRFKYYNQIKQFLYSYLNVPKILNQSSKKYFHPLVSYIDACNLLFDCLQSSPLVQKSILEKALQTIF
jgi:predicted NACHT family NTPase